MGKSLPLERKRLPLEGKSRPDWGKALPRFRKCLPLLGKARPVFRKALLLDPTSRPWRLRPAAASSNHSLFKPLRTFFEDRGVRIGKKRLLVSSPERGANSF